MLHLVFMKILARDSTCPSPLTDRVSPSSFHHHVNTVVNPLSFFPQLLKLVNLPPERDHGTDFSRVREYVLEGQAAKFRQTIITSRFIDPLIAAAFNKSCQSFEGKVRIFLRADYEYGSQKGEEEDSMGRILEDC
jgi:hypothetical protein